MDIMDTTPGRSGYSLAEHFQKAPYAFDFYQAIRILAALKPGCRDFGDNLHLKDEPVIIKSAISYAVPASDLQGIAPNPREGYPPLLTVNFLGISGIQGPLPQPYTEILVERLQQKDSAFRDFLDIFNHRFVTCWYKVQQKFILGLEQKSVEQTSMGQVLLDLAGLSHPELTSTLCLHRRALLNFAPLFWQRQRSVGGLYKLLKGYFNSSIKIKEGLGTWRLAPPGDWSLIGAQKGRHQALGKDFILGRRMWDACGGLQILIEHLSWSDYLHHLPSTRRYTAIKELIRLYEGKGPVIVLKAKIQKREILPTSLGGAGFLGQTTWITRGKGKGLKHDPEVLLLRAED